MIRSAYDGANRILPDFGNAAVDADGVAEARGHVNLDTEAEASCKHNVFPQE